MADWGSTFFSMSALTLSTGLLSLFSPFCLNALSAQEPINNLVSSKGLENEWLSYQTITGCCSLSFPKNPEHVSQKMAIDEDGVLELHYDAYVAAHNQQSVFMLLVAPYPEFVDESYAHTSLESFLNGMVSQSSKNTLISADYILYKGKEALDFYVLSGNVCFKGRALMVQNRFYLMAMECEAQNYNEDNFKTFLSSFKLHDQPLAFNK
jgi:hypothetical protein